jgi:mono/diheme cytochrome c family protein
MSAARNAWRGVALWLTACAGQATADTPSWPVAPTALALSARDWNATHADLGRIAAVAEDGDRVLVFSDHGATLLAGGAAAASDDSVTRWQAAGRIPAADGSGYWAIGVDADGKLYRLRAGNALEKISDRYGLLDDAVISVAAMGAPYVAFGLQDTLVVADGTHVTRYDVPAGRNVSGDAHRVAAVADDGSVRTLDADTHALNTLAVDAAVSSVFFQGQLLVQTPDALYGEHAGQLSVLLHATAKLHGLVVSGERVWFLQGSQLCAAEKAQVACGAADGVTQDSRLFGSASGDAWVLSDGKLARFGVPAEGDEADWRAGPFSVYARVCSSCHAPGGSAGIDLSTYGAWRDRRDKVYQLVVVTQTMPPDRALSDADRMTIEAWSKPR